MSQVELNEDRILLSRQSRLASDKLRDAYATGGDTLPTMLAIAKTRHEEHALLEKMGEKGGTGIDGNPAPKLTNTLVGFFHERDVVFLGADAELAEKIIKDYGTKLSGKLLDELNGSERSVLARIGRGRVKLEKVADPSANGEPKFLAKLSLWGDQWNDWLMVIYMMGYSFEAFRTEV